MKSNSVFSHKSDCQSLITLLTELDDTESCRQLIVTITISGKKMDQKNMIIQNVIIKIFDQSEMQRFKSAFKTKIKNKNKK